MASSEYLKLLNNAAKVTLSKSAKSVDKQVLSAYQIAGLNLVKKYNASKEGSATRAYYASYIKSLYTSMEGIIQEHGLKMTSEIAQIQALVMQEQFKAAGITGVDFNLRFGQIPKDVVRDFMGGNIYKNGKGLSDMIWGNAIKAGADVQTLIGAGISQNISAQALAKQLEEYVDPTKATPFKAGKITGISGKLEYNSLRLARTTLTHMSTQALQKSCNKNPFVEGLKWHTSDSHDIRMHGKKDICDIYETQDKYKMGAGVYPIGKCPFDHPNGLCWQEAYIPKSLDEIGDELKDWIDGGSNAKLDKWAKLNPSLFNAVAERIPAMAATVIKERVAKMEGIPVVEYKVASEIVEVPEVPDEALIKLFNDQKPAEYLNADGLSTFEQNIIEYTAGGVEIEELDDYFKIQVLKLIKDSTSVDNTLYRLEEMKSFTDKLKIGDTFDRDIQSWSKSKGWLENIIDGNGDLEYQNPVLFKIEGKHKELNIQGYSYFTEQEESLMFGKFQVVDIDHGFGGYKIITLKVVDQTDMAEKLIEKEAKSVIKQEQWVDIDDWDDTIELDDFDNSWLDEDDVIPVLDIDWEDEPVTTFKKITYKSEADILKDKVDALMIRDDSEQLISPFDVDKDADILNIYEDFMYSKWDEMLKNEELVYVNLEKLNKIDGVNYYWESEVKEVIDQVTDTYFEYDSAFNAPQVMKIKDKLYLIGNDNYALIAKLQNKTEIEVKYFNWDKWDLDNTASYTHEEVVDMINNNFPSTATSIDYWYTKGMGQNLNPYGKIVGELNDLSQYYSSMGNASSASELKQYAKHYTKLMNEWVPKADAVYENIDDILESAKETFTTIVTKKIENIYNKAVVNDENPYEKLQEYFADKALAFADNNSFIKSDKMEMLNIAMNDLIPKWVKPEAAKFITKIDSIEDIMTNMEGFKDTGNLSFYKALIKDADDNNDFAAILKYLEGDIKDPYINNADKKLCEKLYEQIAEFQQVTKSAVKNVAEELTTTEIADVLMKNLNVITGNTAKKSIEYNIKQNLNPYDSIAEFVNTKLEIKIKRDAAFVGSVEFKEVEKLIDKIKVAEVDWEKANNYDNLTVFEKLDLFYEELDATLGSGYVDEIKEIFNDGIMKNVNPLQEMVDYLKDVKSTYQQLKSTMTIDAYNNLMDRADKMLKEFENITKGYIKDLNTGANIPLVHMVGSNGQATYHFGFGNAMKSINTGSATSNAPAIPKAPKKNIANIPAGEVSQSKEFDEILYYVKGNVDPYGSSVSYKLKDICDKDVKLGIDPKNDLLEFIDNDMKAATNAYKAGYMETSYYNEYTDYMKEVYKKVDDLFAVAKKPDAVKTLDKVNGILDDIEEVYGPHIKTLSQTKFNEALAEGKNPFKVLADTIEKSLKSLDPSNSNVTKVNAIKELLKKTKRLSDEYNSAKITSLLDNIFDDVMEEVVDNGLPIEIQNIEAKLEFYKKNKSGNPDYEKYADIYEKYYLYYLEEDLSVEDLIDMVKLDVEFLAGKTDPIAIKKHEIFSSFLNILQGKEANAIILKSFNDILDEAASLFGPMGTKILNHDFDDALMKGENPYAKAKMYIQGKADDYELSINALTDGPLKEKFENKLIKTKTMVEDLKNLEDDFAKKIPVATPLNLTKVKPKSFDELIKELNDKDVNGDMNLYISTYDDYYKKALAAGNDAHRIVLNVLNDDLEFLKDMDAPINKAKYNMLVDFKKDFMKLKSGGTNEEKLVAKIVFSEADKKKEIQAFLDLVENEINEYVVEDFEDVIEFAIMHGKNPFDDVVNTIEAKNKYWMKQFHSAEDEFFQDEAESMLDGLDKIKEQALILKKKWNGSVEVVEEVVEKADDVIDALTEQAFKKFNTTVMMSNNVPISELKKIQKLINDSYKTSLEDGTNPFDDVISALHKYGSNSSVSEEVYSHTSWLAMNIDDYVDLWGKSPDKLKKEFLDIAWNEGEHALQNELEEIYNKAVINGVNPYYKIKMKMNNDYAHLEDIIDDGEDNFTQHQIFMAEKKIDIYDEMFEKIEILEKSYVIPPKPKTFGEIKDFMENKMSMHIKITYQNAYDQAILDGLNPYTVMIDASKKNSKMFESIGNDEMAKNFTSMIKDFQALEKSYIIPKAKPKLFKPMSDIPNENQLKFLQDGKYLGGAGEKSIYFDRLSPDSKYIFKPAINKDGSDALFKAHIQEAASDVQKLVEKKSAIDVKVITLDDSFGVIQPLLETESLTFGTVLTEQQIAALQREHVVDWLLGNFDSHQNNFIKSGNKILGIDKEQAFKYIDDTDSYKMSINYHPNSKYGESEPIYNRLFREYSEGRISMDLNETYKYIEKVMNVPDAEYAKIFRSYAEGLYGVGDRAEELLNKIVAKKNSLLSDYEEFFTKLESIRVNDDFIFHFDIENYKSKQIVFEDYKKIGRLPYLGSESPNKNIARDSDFLESVKDRIRPLENYSGSDYEAFNEWMRDGSEYLSDRVKKEADELEKFFLSIDQPLMEDTLLYRHADRSAMEKMFNKEASEISKKIFEATDDRVKAQLIDQLNDMLVEATCKDKGFISTAYKEGVFTKNRGVEFQIYAPKGFSRGVFIEKYSYHPSEAEFLINAGQEFEVLEVTLEDVYDGCGKTKNIVIKLKPINLE